MPKIDVEGLQELIDKVNKLANVESKEIKKKALEKSADKVKRTMESKAPRSNLVKQHMAENINKTAIKECNGYDYIEVGPNKGDNSEFYYSKFTEWGTSKMPAQYWAENSLSENKKEINNIIIDELKKGLNNMGIN